MSPLLTNSDLEQIIQFSLAVWGPKVVPYQGRIEIVYIHKSTIH
jgi:hypothetical protein